MVRGRLQSDLLPAESAVRSAWATQPRQGRETGYARRFLEGERRYVPRHVSPGSTNRRHRRLLLHRLLRFSVRAQSDDGGASAPEELPEAIAPCPRKTQCSTPAQNTKLQRNTNLQTPKATPAAMSQICLPVKDAISLVDFSEVGSLGFLWILEFGVLPFALNQPLYLDCSRSPGRTPRNRPPSPCSSIPGRF